MGERRAGDETHEHHEPPPYSGDRGTGPAGPAPGPGRAAWVSATSVDTVMQRLGRASSASSTGSTARMGYHLPTEGLEDVVAAGLRRRSGRGCRNYAGTSALETWVYGFCRNCLRAEFRRRDDPLAGWCSAEDQLCTSRCAEVAGARSSSAVQHGESGLAPRGARTSCRTKTGRSSSCATSTNRSFEQIARQKNLPPSTIKDRCYRADRQDPIANEEALWPCMRIENSGSSSLPSPTRT